MPSRRGGLTAARCVRGCATAGPDPTAGPCYVQLACSACCPMRGQATLLRGQLEVKHCTLHRQCQITPYDARQPEDSSLTLGRLPPPARCSMGTPCRLLTARPAVARRVACRAGVQLQLGLARPRERCTPAHPRVSARPGMPRLQAVCSATAQLLFPKSFVGHHLFHSVTLRHKLASKSGSVPGCKPHNHKLAVLCAYL